MLTMSSVLQVSASQERLYPIYPLCSPECLKQTGRRWAGWGVARGVYGWYVMLWVWWLLLYPHPVSWQGRGAITNIDPNFLKCRLLFVYWLVTFRSHSSWGACGAENTSGQNPLAGNTPLPMSLENLHRVDTVTEQTWWQWLVDYDFPWASLP